MTLSETLIEQELQAKNLNAPRLNPQHIDNTIVSEEYHTFGGHKLTVCCLTLVNGFKLIGESSCVSAENFNQELGNKIARDNAREKIWMLEGYLLKQKLFETDLSTK